MTRLAWLGALAGVGLLGCMSVSDAGSAGVNVLGQWSYSATQTSPAAATLSGTLLLTVQNGREFQGTLDVIQQDGQGGIAHLAGVVSGQVLDSTSVVFTAFLDVSGRQHLAKLAHDSVQGSWVEQAGGQVTGSGAFIATKGTAP